MFTMGKSGKATAKAMAAKKKAKADSKTKAKSPSKVGAWEVRSHASNDAHSNDAQ